MLDDLAPRGGPGDDHAASAAEVDQALRRAASATRSAPCCGSPRAPRRCPSRAGGAHPEPPPRPRSRGGSRRRPGRSAPTVAAELRLTGRMKLVILASCSTERRLASPSPGVADRLRALFDEAWRRARRRRLLIAAAAGRCGGRAVVVLSVGESACARGCPSRPRRRRSRCPRSRAWAWRAPRPTASRATGSASPSGWTRSRERLVASVGGRSVALRDAHIRCSADPSCPRLYLA